MILVDDRVGSKEISHHLDVPHQLARLSFGDACWVGNGPDGEGMAYVGVERKTLSDLISSMESGRLTTHQLPGMMNTYHWSYVVVEGIWRPGKTGLIEVFRRRNWTPFGYGSRRYPVSTLDNFLNALSCMFNVTVVATPSLGRTGAWMSNVYRWWTSKKWNQHKSCRGKVTIPVPVVGVGKAPLVARVAMELKGVGVDRAMALAREFPTVEKLCKARLKHLMKVEGIGKTTAKGIQDQLTG